MISGAPHEARWVRAEPRRTLALSALNRLIRSAFGDCHIVDALPLNGGFRNANFKIKLDNHPGWLVLRIYEHDESLCQKEIDLMRLLQGSVPVAQIIHAEPRSLDDLPPFIVMQFVEGISFRDLKRSPDKNAIAQAAFSVGQALAAIGRFTFPKSGWLAPGPTVTSPLLAGVDPTPRFVDLCLESTNLQLRMSSGLRDRVHAFVGSWAPRLAGLDSETCLVHGDFGKQNLLVRCDQGIWRVVAVLDWEFAISASPLCDLGHLLRYERASRPFAEPYFSEGYLNAGGKLPPDWWALARVVDLTALCESLTHDQLPDAVVAELVELIRAIIENRDPVLP
jgi:aminoglycoside phosphotransferase (APT) family kinase protein